MGNRVFKRLVEDTFSGDLSVKETMCETYEYGGYRFGIFWENGTIYAIELQSGVAVACRSRSGTKKPKQELLEEIACRVENGDLKHYLFRHQQHLDREKAGLKASIEKCQYKIDNVYKFPLNDEI